MRATAAHPSDPGGERLAPVVDITSRQAVAPAGSSDGNQDGREHAARYWAAAFERAGIDLNAPQPPVDVIRVVSAEFDRLLGGLLKLREGLPEFDIPASPGRGIDVTSSVEVSALMRDLVRAVEDATRNQA